MFPVDSMLKSELRGVKGEMKRPFDKAAKDYEAKFIQIEKEKKAQAKEAGMVRTEVDSGVVADEMEKERRLYQLQTCEKSCQRYCLLYKASRHGIDRLEICESKEDKNPKIITLENCVKITQEPSPANLIQIVKKTGTLTLNALVDEDLKEWTNALQAVAFRDKSGTKDNNIAIEEDNDLYCSSFGDGLFLVSLTPSETSKRCNIEPKAYMLHLTATELQLKFDEDFNTIVANWPYRFIRKYGYRDGKFTFEAGRKCNTGEGTFILNHINPHEIFRCMSSKMKSMKKLISGESLNNIDCGEKQLSAVAFMEAGSRSPMPQSPSNQIINELDINSNPSCISAQGFISSTDSLNNCSTSSISNSYISPQKYSSNNVQWKSQQIYSSKMEKTKPTSNRLEQKSNNQTDSFDAFKKFSNYELVSITTSVDPNKTAGSTVILNPLSFDSVIHSRNPPQLPIRNESAKTAERDYESIKAISDAWKTLGVNEVKHSERCVSAVDDGCINFLIPKALQYQDRNPLRDFSPTNATKIVDIDFGEGVHCIEQKNDFNYDRLDFLPPNNKTSGGYKTVVTVSPAVNVERVCCGSPTNNDYELIACPDMQTFREADDSHLGYGIIRKSICSSTTRSSNTNMSYSIIDNNNIPISTTKDQITSQENPVNSRNDSSLDRRNYNGLNYTIVSKPKIV